MLLGKYDFIIQVNAYRVAETGFMGLGQSFSDFFDPFGSVGQREAHPFVIRMGQPPRAVTG